MITTQHGSEVEVLERLGDGWVKVLRVSDGETREWHASQLRADTPEELTRLNVAAYG